MSSECRSSPPLTNNVSAVVEPVARQDVLLNIMEQKDLELQKVKGDLCISNDIWHHLAAKVETLNSFLQVNRSVIENLNSLLLESREAAAAKDQRIAELQSELRIVADEEVNYRKKIEAALDNLISQTIRAEKFISYTHHAESIKLTQCDFCKKKFTNLAPSSNVHMHMNTVKLEPSGDSGLGLSGAIEDTTYNDTNINRDVRPSVSAPTLSMLSSSALPFSTGQKWATVLPQVLYYLDTATIFSCAQVCSSWRACSLHSDRWRHVELSNCLVNSKYLMAISKYCKKTESLRLKDLLLPPLQEFETTTEHEQRTRGMLELGLEILLQASHHGIQTVSLINCGNMLTERAVWLVSCICNNLEHLAYISCTHPVSSEVVWSLGAGCRNLRTLIIPPLHPNKKTVQFNNRTLALIGKAFPFLKTLCVGGPQIDERGLVKIAESCKHLQVFELDHMGEVREQTAIKLCQSGLVQLNELSFTFTPVTPKALYHFYKSCINLRRIFVYISIQEYFPGSTSSRTCQRKYQEQIDQLMKLQNRPRLRKILKIEAEPIS